MLIIKLMNYLYMYMYMYMYAIQNNVVYNYCVFMAMFNTIPDTSLDTEGPCMQGMYSGGPWYMYAGDHGTCMLVDHDTLYMFVGGPWCMYAGGTMVHMCKGTLVHVCRGTLVHVCRWIMVHYTCL